MKTLLLTAYNADMAPIGDLTSPLMLDYANRHGFDFHCTRQIDPSQHYWQKIWDIRSFMSPSNPVRKKYDRVFYLDSDQVITNPDWTPPWSEGFHASLDWGTDAVDDTFFSACGFVVCKDMVNVISAVANDYEEFANEPFPEQAALRQYRRKAHPWFAERMHTHPRRVFNAVPKEISEEAPDPWQPGDFTAHLTHVEPQRRAEVFHIIREQSNQ